MLVKAKKPCLRVTRCGAEDLFFVFLSSVLLHVQILGAGKSLSSFYSIYVSHLQRNWFTVIADLAK